MRQIPIDYPATRREIAAANAARNPRDASAWAILASALIDLCLYRQARAALKRLATVGRDAYQVCIRHGEYYDAIGQLKRAEGWYRKAAAEDPGALVSLGAVLAKQGRLAAAKSSHRLAARAPHTDYLARDEAYLNWGLVSRAERRYGEALGCFDRAIALDPKYTAALEAKADVRAAMSLEVPDDRSIHWRQMLDAMGDTPATCHEFVRAYTKRYPQRYGGWVVLAGVLADFARYNEAVDALRRGVTMARKLEWKEPPDHHFHEQWGLLHETKRDFRRAELSFGRAVALRPSARNLTYLARVLIVQGRFGPAKPLLQRAIRISADDLSTAHYQLGLIARARRQYPEALQRFDAAIRYRRSFPLARVARRDVRKAMTVRRSKPDKGLPR